MLTAILIVLVLGIALITHNQVSIERKVNEIAKKVNSFKCKGGKE